MVEAPNAGAAFQSFGEHIAIYLARPAADSITSDPWLPLQSVWRVALPKMRELPAVDETDAT